VPFTALGEISRYTGPQFTPYTTQTLTTLCTLLNTDADNNMSYIYSNTMLRSEVAEALSGMIMPAVATLGGDIEWTKGEANPAMTKPPLTPQIQEVSQMCLQALIVILKEDMDSAVVGKSCESMQAILELLGPASLAPVANECLEAVHSLLSGKAPCQESFERALLGEDGNGDGDDDLDDDLDEHESYMVHVMDLVGAMGRILGSSFAQYLPQYLPAICRWGKPSKPAEDRAMTMGILGELAQEIDAASLSPHVESVFYPAIQAGLADEDGNVQRNAAFLTGVTCETLGDAMSPQYMQLLQLLSPMFALPVTVSEDVAPIVDNAAAAVARMITTCPSAVPLEQVLPTFLSVLPLKDDMTENETVYGCLLTLLGSNNAVLAAQKAELLRVFQAAVADENVQENVKAQLSSALASLQ